MFDPKKMLAESDTIQGMEALLKAAYDQGCEDTRQAIIAAASAPVADKAAFGDKVDAEVVRAPRKAPRGTVPKILGRMLTEYPGRTVVEYEEMVKLYDSRVATKSIGNELRRMEGKRYRRNADGQWFLMKLDEEAGGGRETNSPAFEYANREGGD